MSNNDNAAYLLMNTKLTPSGNLQTVLCCLILGIAVTATLAFVALVTMTIFAIKHYRRKNHSYGRLSEESTVFRSSYGTANEEA